MKPSAAGGIRKKPIASPPGHRMSPAGGAWAPPASSSGDQPAWSTTQHQPGGMAEQYVPDDIREFILKHIASVAQIEALLLIWSFPDERWGLSRIAARIYTSE